MAEREISKKEEKVRAVWEKHKDEELRLSEVFQKYLGEHFDVSYVKGNSDWLVFMSWWSSWTKKERAAKKQEKAAEKMRGLSEEAIEEIQDSNRKKMIIMLSNLLEGYSKEGDVFKKTMSISEIRRLYKSIQDLEEKKKMTQIARGKLGLETVKILLPYQRMSLEQLLALKEKFNESFERILKLKSGEPAGPDGPVSG